MGINTTCHTPFIDPSSFIFLLLHNQILQLPWGCVPHSADWTLVSAKSFRGEQKNTPVMSLRKMLWPWKELLASLPGMNFRVGSMEDLLFWELCFLDLKSTEVMMLRWLTTCAFRFKSWQLNCFQLSMCFFQKTLLWSRNLHKYVFHVCIQIWVSIFHFCSLTRKSSKAQFLKRLQIA